MSTAKTCRKSGTGNGATPNERIGADRHHAEDHVSAWWSSPKTAEIVTEVTGYRMSAMLLAGDVGGTKTTLGLFPLGGDPKTPKVETTFQSAKYPDLESIVREFLAQNRASVRYASFGVAGPVIEGRAIITNLPWVVEEKSLAASLNIPDAHLMNDLEAIAKSVPLLARTDLAALNQGRPESRGARRDYRTGHRAGRGLHHPRRAATPRPSIRRRARRLRPHQRVSGRTSQVPSQALRPRQLRGCLLGHRNTQHPRILREDGPPEQHSHAKELEVEDPVPIIVAAALSKSRRCKTCSLTMDTFASILGAEAGNLALKVLATGGVYIAGGIPRNVLPLLKNESFITSFTKKGRMSQLVSRIQVHVVLRPGIALLGAASSGFESMRPGPKLSRELREGREMKRVSEGARSLVQRDSGDG